VRNKDGAPAAPSAGVASIRNSRLSFSRSPSPGSRQVSWARPNKLAGSLRASSPSTPPVVVSGAPSNTSSFTPARTSPQLRRARPEVALVADDSSIKRAEAAWEARLQAMSPPHPLGSRTPPFASASGTRTPSRARSPMPGQWMAQHQHHPMHAVAQAQFEVAQAISQSRVLLSNAPPSVPTVPSMPNFLAGSFCQLPPAMVPQTPVALAPNPMPVVAPPMPIPHANSFRQPAVAPSSPWATEPILQGMAQVNLTRNNIPLTDETTQPPWYPSYPSYPSYGGYSAPYDDALCYCDYPQIPA